MNARTISIFSVILILAGVLGFLLPPGLMSNEGLYNLFHIVFGALGLVIFFQGRAMSNRAFNIGFGLLDIYQALASRLGLFPIAYFRWTRVDDILHVLVGVVLVCIGFYFER